MAITILFAILWAISGVMVITGAFIPSTLTILGLYSILFLVEVNTFFRLWMKERE